MVKYFQVTLISKDAVSLVTFLCQKLVYCGELKPFQGSNGHDFISLHYTATDTL